jgi:PAS domain S-box-containing protein
MPCGRKETPWSEWWSESEERFRTIFEEAPLGVALIDSLTGRICEVNPRFAEIAGRTKAEMVTIDWMSITHPDDVQEDLDNMALMNAGKIHGFNMDKRYLHPDGCYVWISMTIAPMTVKDKSHTRHLCMIEDITERKRAEEKLKDTMDSLRRAVSATIQVMVSAVETRDPYTAGHQIRSAALSRAIATEMGLSGDQIDAIRMAGSIHDIGKLSIPAEILAKPTKLSEIEFKLIQEHARQGYEILKNIESSWPLAEMVYQHHERMDGSGYPRNLKGGDILIEARILAVADVVESMASHRPYRPALGINTAMEEIQKNSGTLYDKAVADVCLRLFRERGFQFEP